MVLALEKVDENTIAQTIINNLPDEALCSKQPVTLSEETVDENTVEELSKLHETFSSLCFDCENTIQQLVEKGAVSLSIMVRRVKNERAYNLSSELSDVEKINRFFDIISVHYHFLDCHLLVVLVKQFLNPSELLIKLQTHVQSIKDFKNNMKIKLLHNTLTPFAKKSAQETPVTIKVQNAWEEHELWLVEVLIRTMFRLQHRDVHKWFRVIPGSLTIVFLVPQHISPSLVEHM